MTNILNKIALKYNTTFIGDRVLMDTENKSNVRKALMTFASVGYTVDDSVIDLIKYMQEDDFNDWLIDTKNNLDEKIGNHKSHNPLNDEFLDYDIDSEKYLKDFIALAHKQFEDYVDFQVLSCGHIVSNGNYCPICNNHDDVSDVGKNPFIVLTLATQDSLNKLFYNLISSPVSISDDDKDTIEMLIIGCDEVLNFIPSEIPFKENLIYVFNVLFNNNKDVSVLYKMFNNANDILRLATAFSGGDITLKEKCRYKLTNKQRKIVMSLLDQTTNQEETLKNNRNKWIKLAEVCHIGKFSKKYPNASNMIDVLRNKPSSITTFNGMMENYLLCLKTDENVLSDLLTLMSQRPGIFVRKIGHILDCTSECKHYLVYDAFDHVIDKVTTPVLLNLKSYLNSRLTVQEKRHFIPKGMISKIQYADDNRKTLPVNTVKYMCNSIDSILIERFSKMDSIGKVKISPKLKTCLLPMSQRSSVSGVTLTKGSRVQLDNNKRLRFFLWWKNIDTDSYNSRVDVDLSAVMYNDEWQYIDDLSYMSLSSVDGTHSGDITDAPNGASEFIDIDVSKAIKNNTRYILMSVNVYTGQGFNEFENFAGLMTYDNNIPTYDPLSVNEKFTIQSSTKFNIPMIIDLYTMEMIWCDMSLTSAAGHNVRSNRNNLVEYSKIVENMVNTKPNLYDLLWLHAYSRGELIEYENDDVVVDVIYDESYASKIDEIMMLMK